MFLVNLTWLQFAALYGGITTAVVALYLWDRSRRRIVVPTLRFWIAAERSAEVRHRRRIQQPVSLVLQLIAAGLLLLALAELRLGTPGQASRDHVLILDTSAWMAAPSGSEGALLELARAQARAYLASLPSSDRVMLVRADALATPATRFELNRRTVEQAIQESRPGSTALNLQQALDFARQAQRLQSSRGGEIVYAGPGRVADNPDDLAQRRGPNLRVLPVPAGIGNCGLKKVVARRSASDPDIWEILADVHNYGPKPCAVSVALAFGGSPAGSQSLALEAGAERNAEFRYRMRAAGWLETRILPGNGLAGNNRALLELPARRMLRVAVYSDEPDLLRPVLAGNPGVEAVFRKPSEYQPGGADIAVFDRFAPSPPPQVDAIWIEPPEQQSPAPVRSVVSGAALTAWRSDHPAGAGLRTKDLRLESTQVFRPSPGDVAIAEVDAGPVILARAGKPKTFVLGFHPVRGAMRYELATPLLFANILRWMEPDIFHLHEFTAGNVGTVSVVLGQNAAKDAVRVTTARGTPLPYTIEGEDLRFFSGAPGMVRVTAGDREMDFSMSLPELAESKWTPPPAARRGIPPRESERSASRELWPWLAFAAALLLAAEWLAFGGGASYRLPPLRRAA